MIVAGFGCRPGARLEDFQSALDIALQSAGCPKQMLSAIALPHFRKDDEGAKAAMRQWPFSIAIIDQPALEQACTRAETRSALAQAHTGLSSVAESAALAAAGKDSRLLAKRVSAGGVTCAIAIGEARL